MMRNPMWAYCIAAAATAALQMPAQARANDPAVTGRSLYFGFSLRDIPARLGAEHTVLTLRDLPCSGCHGGNGAGLIEAGLHAPDVRVRVSRAKLRDSDEDSSLDQYLLGVLRSHQDHIGRTLSARMPSYAFEPKELAALIAYLRVLGQREPPAAGVDEESIHLATIQPAETPAGRAVMAVLRAGIARYNAQGGINGRRLRLTQLTRPGDFDPTQHFALLVPALAASDDATQCTWAGMGIPVIRPLRGGTVCESDVRMLLAPVAGLDAQVRGLWAQLGGHRRVRMVVNAALSQQLGVRPEWMSSVDLIANADGALIQYLREHRNGPLVILATTAQWRAVIRQGMPVPLQGVAAPLSSMVEVLGELGPQWWSNLLLATSAPVPDAAQLDRLSGLLAAIPGASALQWIALDALDVTAIALRDMGSRPTREHLFERMTARARMPPEWNGDSIAYLRVTREGRLNVLERAELNSFALRRLP